MALSKPLVEGNTRLQLKFTTRGTKRVLPLNKYNVEQIFKTVSLGTISRYGGGHLGFWIGIQSRRQLDPGAAAASYIKGKYISPSWRRIIFSLDTVDNTSVADELIPYSEPPADPSLTVERVTPIFRSLKDWAKIDQYIVIPRTRADVIRSQHSSLSEQQAQAAIYYVNCYPDEASWSHLAMLLYRWEKSAAAIMMFKSQLPKVQDPTLTPENVLAELQEVQLWREDESFCYLDMPKLTHRRLSCCGDGGQRKSAVVNEYLSHHPYPRWGQIVELLDTMAFRGKARAGLAQEVKDKYMTNMQRLSLPLSLPPSLPPSISKGKKATRGEKAASKEGGDKMASIAAGRKRRGNTTAADVRGEGDDVRGEGDVGTSVEVGNPPPSKQSKNDKETSDPVEETDQAVLVTKMVADTGSRQRQKTAKNKEPLPMETEEVPPISHPSHSNVCGQVFLMGQGDMGQLGLGEDVMEQKKPHPVGGVLEGSEVIQVVCGGMHTVVLTKDGKVFTWGCNDKGALGRVVNNSEEFNPGVVAKLEGVKVVQVAAGDSHTAALTDTGSIYCWGVFQDSNGVFGLVQTSPSLSPELIYSTPYNRAVKVTSGSDHVVFLTEDSDIYTFGCAEQGQLGRVPECFSSRGGRKGISLILNPDVFRYRVKKGAGKPKFCDIFCGPYHTFAITQDGAVYAWGLNNYGQLCTGDTKTRFQPESLGSKWLDGQEVGGAKDFAMASGQHHTVVCCNGSVFVCGKKENGRLGLGQDCEEPSKPTQIDSLKGLNVKNIGVGRACTFAVTETGDLFSWGMGTNLQLGMSDEEDVWSPAKVTGKKIENARVLAVSSGGQHTALLVSVSET